MRKKKRGQSLLEYTLLITVIVLVAVYAAKSIIGAKAKAIYDNADTMLGTANTEFATVTGAGVGD